MHKVKIIRRIYDGSSLEDSKFFASTTKDITLPIPPFVGMIILMPFGEEINKIMVHADTQEVSCFLSDYYGNMNSQSCMGLCDSYPDCIGLSHSGTNCWIKNSAAFNSSNRRDLGGVNTYFK